MKNTLILSLTALVLAGCGNDNTITTNANILPDLVPDSGRLTITAQNAAILGASMRDVLNGSGALDDEVNPGSSLATIQAISWASVVQEMFNALPLFVQGGSRAVPGPSGGTVQVAVNGSSTTLVFNNFSVNNATIQGEVAFTSSGTSAVNATFRQFQVSRLGAQAFQIDGPAFLQETRVTGGAGLIDRDTYLYAFTVTDLVQAGGGTAAVNITTQDNREVTPTTVRSVTETGGTILFNNFRTLTGSVDVINTQPWVYTLALPAGNVTLTAGGGLVQGNGAIRRTVIAPNTIQTELQTAGGAEFTVIR